MDISALNLEKLSLKEILVIAHGKNNEGEVLELKDDILKPSSISDYIAQFSNNRGGLLIFGLNDDGTPSGKIKHYDKTNEISIQEGALTTTPSVAIGIKSFWVSDESCWVIVVKIPKPADRYPKIILKWCSRETCRFTEGDNSAFGILFRKSNSK